MTGDERLAALFSALRAAGLRCLVMGGHAVRHYGVDRSTIDYDLHLGLDAERWKELPSIVAEVPEIGAAPEGSSWRPADFRRFVVGTLPDGREERLEFWRHNHLLAPFEELWARREEAGYGGARVAFLGLDDLIRSKETEREDDWRDVSLLEEIADERRLASARDHDSRVLALAALRSRRGFSRAELMGLLSDAVLVGEARSRARHAIAAAWLAPIGGEPLGPAHENLPEPIRALLDGPLRRVAPGSPRHVALVEALRRLYRQAAMAADRADKQRIASGQA